MSTITLSGNTYNLVTLPSSPGLSEVSFGMEDAIAIIESPYVPSQIQAQQWPGADRWTAQLTLPKMMRTMAAPWLGLLGATQGMFNVFQFGDPLGRAPAGVATGTPLVDGTVGGGNAVGTNILYTKGWTASIAAQLLAGDYLQIGYRLYQVTAQGNSDGAGKIALSIWPSLRETPADAAPVTLANAVGVFRLAANKRQWHAANDRLAQISLSLIEVR